MVRAVADPGPSIIFRLYWGPKGQKKFFETHGRAVEAKDNCFALVGAHANSVAKPFG